MKRDTEGGGCVCIQSLDLQNPERKETHKTVFNTNNTGRFIMFSVITNIYNKKSKGPTLMELFTDTGKLKTFLFDNQRCSICAPRVIRHTSIRYSSCCHTRVNICWEDPTDCLMSSRYNLKPQTIFFLNLSWHRCLQIRQNWGFCTQHECNVDNQPSDVCDINARSMQQYFLALVVADNCIKNYYDAETQNRHSLQDLGYFIIALARIQKSDVAVTGVHKK